MEKHDISAIERSIGDLKFVVLSGLFCLVVVFATLGFMSAKTYCLVQGKTPDRFECVTTPKQIDLGSELQ